MVFSTRSEREPRDIRMEELLATVFSVRSVSRCYKRDESRSGSPHHWKSYKLHIGPRLKFPYVYYYITKLCRQQTEVVKNHDSEQVRSIEQSEGRHRKCNRLELSACQAYDR
jgi:hypothetical protein